MEQYRTRSVDHPQRQQQPERQQPRRPAPTVGAVPAQGGRPRPAPARRLPRARLTGLGGGLFACVAMTLVAGIAWLLFGGSLLAYGLLFLPVAAATALWVRPADLITAPISAPIAFAVGVWPLSGGSGGFGAELMGIVSALSLHAGWLYGGTLVSALIVVVRKAVLISRRRLPRRTA
ncbi:membrane protein [Streptomyces sp. XY332]|nr:membrane protein [Streptomyces sp. XY332]